VSELPRRWIVATGLVAAATLIVVVAVLVRAGSGDAPPENVLTPSADVSSSGAIVLDVGSGGRATKVPAGYLGLSIEFQAVRDYTGSDPRHINPVLVQLIRNLSPGQAPVLRIGGDSTDMSWVPARGVKPPDYEAYPLTPSWLATTAALARTLKAHMTMGINFADNSPKLARAEAEAYLRTIGRTRISALEIGNEPNVYPKIKGLKIGPKRFRRARPRGYSYPAFARQFGALAAALPPVPLAGPALAVGPKSDPGTWVGSVGRLLSAHPRLRTLTIHRYPLRNCYVPPRSPQYPSVAHLLSSYASATLAASLKRWVRIAHSHGRKLRLDELNSVACRGKPAISDAFASSLWVTDALFALARAGIDGVNLHTLPRSAYELFHFRHTGRRWSAYVQPVYYGLALFAAATPPGSRVLAVSGPTHASGLSLWVTRARDDQERAVLVNESATRSRTVSLHMPARVGGTAHVTRLLAPSVYARTGVTLGGQSYGGATTTGRLPAPHTQTLTARRGGYTLTVPHGSAALVTFPR
jgi:hypothetical protein